MSWVGQGDEMTLWGTTPHPTHTGTSSIPVAWAPVILQVSHVTLMLANQFADGEKLACFPLMFQSKGPNSTPVP